MWCGVVHEERHVWKAIKHSCIQVDVNVIVTGEGFQMQLCCRGIFVRR